MRCKCGMKKKKRGRGLYLKPYRGQGLYLRPYGRGRGRKGRKR